MFVLFFLQGVQYRQVFKDIREQGIEWSKVKQDKQKAANDVNSAMKKVNKFYIQVLRQM